MAMRMPIRPSLPIRPPLNPESWAEMVRLHGRHESRIDTVNQALHRHEARIDQQTARIDQAAWCYRGLCDDFESMQRRVTYLSDSVHHLAIVVLILLALNGALCAALIIGWFR